MARKFLSPTAVIAWFGFFVVLAGVAFAASNIGSPSTGVHMIVRDASIQHHVQPPRSSTVVAYALVTPLCDGCDPPRGFTPIVTANSSGVSLGSPPATATSGDWCFTINTRLSPSDLTIVTSPEGGQTSELPGTHPTSLASAQWVMSAPDCGPGEIEVRTVRYTASAGGLIATPDNDIAFSFIVVS